MSERPRMIGKSKKRRFELETVGRNNNTSDPLSLNRLSCGLSSQSSVSYSQKTPKVQQLLNFSSLTSTDMLKRAFSCTIKLEETTSHRQEFIKSPNTDIGLELLSLLSQNFLDRLNGFLYYWHHPASKKAITVTKKGTKIAWIQEIENSKKNTNTFKGYLLFSFSGKLATGFILEQNISPIHMLSVTKNFCPLDKWPSCLAKTFRLKQTEILRTIQARKCCLKKQRCSSIPSLML